MKTTDRAPVPAATPRPRKSDKDRPLVEDIRLLGRMLGDVIREQEGAAAFELVETHPQALGGVPPRRRPRGRQGAQKAAQEPQRRPDRERDPRLHLLQPPGQSGRRPPPHPPPRRARARGRHARGQHRRGPVPPALGRHHAQGHFADAGGRLRVARAHRAPHRSAAQEHPGRRARHRPAADRSATPCAPVHCPRTRWPRASWPPTKRSCGPACCSCGRRGCCASPNSRWPTRSKTR